MTRSRKSARNASTRFERSVADWLATVFNDDRIDRRVKRGVKDRGDIAGVRAHGRPVVLELKDVSRIDLAGWVREAHIEAGNDDALVGLVVHKRRGTADPGEQYVTMTLADLVTILTGDRPDGAAPENDAGGILGGHGQTKDGPPPGVDAPGNSGGLTPGWRG